MSKYYIQIVNEELPVPMYVERGLGFGGVKLTDSLRAAKRYDTEEEAEKVAALARAQKDKERGGECTTVEIVREGVEAPDGWEVRARFDVPSIDASSRFEMKKTDSGIMSRYVGIDGKTSREYGGDEMKKAVSDWINATGAWFASKISGKKAKE